ncbi:MAG: LytR C-terminal domain-containing protein, partial [Rhodovibrionaceae bacterium]|nr:LytR C-terminal domain-containing protein [Rhodovibrionaceae bacterium]
ANAAPRQRLAVTAEAPATKAQESERMQVERRRANEYRLRTQPAAVEPVVTQSLADDHRSAARPARPAPEGRPEQIVLQSAPEAIPARERKTTPRQEMQRAPVVEVSNGAGRRRMAARMRGYFTDQGVPVQRLTNADHFAHQSSTVFYRPGWEEEAEVLASYLPVSVAISPEPNQSADLRLELGGDLLAFDASLINRSDEPVEKQPEPEKEEEEQKPETDFTS